MSIEKSNTEKKKRRSSGTSGAGLGRFKIFRVIMWAVIIIVVLLALFGIINQRATGQSFIEGFVNAGNQTSTVLDSIFFNKEDSPLEYNQDGIYLKGHTPTDNQRNAEEQQKQQEEQQNEQQQEQQDEQQQE